MPSHEEDGHQTGHIDNDGEQTQTGQTQLQDTLKWYHNSISRLCINKHKIADLT